ncbi:MAG: hypothetical protein JEY78_01720 [Lutibacter sp.]|nr:hypothetical protein [Lutibacter sp.]
MKKKSNIYILCFFFVFVSLVGYSKTPPTPIGPPAEPGLPIDGGLFYLLISGVLYGVYELKKKK